MSGPDFSDVDSRTKAEALARTGSLEPMLLLPAEFGGQEVPPNVVFVPVGVAGIKHDIDRDIIGPLVAEGTLTRYAATPEYTGVSFVPIAITIVASEPGSFSTTVNIWGEALTRPEGLESA